MGVRTNRKQAGEKTAGVKGCTVSRATLDDLPVLVPLFDAYRVFYRQPSDPAVAHAFLRARIEWAESVILLAADARGKALGFTQLYPCFSSVSAGRVWILNDLYVEPETRRHGVAKALVKAAHAHAIATGALRVTLSTARDNIQARALYESLGYTLETSMFDYAFNLA